MTNLHDRNGRLLSPGDRVLFQISPRLPWASGTVAEDGRVRSDRDGRLSVPWSSCLERAAA